MRVTRATEMRAVEPCRMQARNGQLRDAEEASADRVLGV